MARKCSASGCSFPLPEKYPLDKCPWHMAPGQGPVKIAAALAIAAAGLGGGFAYKKFRTYLSEKKLRRNRQELRQHDASVSEQAQKVSAPVRKVAASKPRKQPRKRKTPARKSKRAD